MKLKMNLKSEVGFVEAWSTVMGRPHGGHGLGHVGGSGSLVTSALVVLTV